tara:strand:+ start:124 stop:1134 length:1011 start_codon:yes stop_codon:yes gene_type:complete
MKKLLGIVVLGLLLSGCATLPSMEHQSTSGGQITAHFSSLNYTEIKNRANFQCQQHNSKAIATNIVERYKGGLMKFGEGGEYSIFVYRCKIPEKTVVKKPKKKEPKLKIDNNKIVPASSGTGFIVTRSGQIITNHHVIEGCNIVKVNFKGNETNAKIIAVDKMNDISILQANINPDKVFSVSNEDVTLLEDVVVAGYPLGKKVSSAIKTHKGVVTALAGYGDNYSNFQTDATINQGNSGGPVVNQKGNVVGIAVALMPAETAQNIFFAVKSSTLKTFANSNGLKFLPPNNKDLSNKDLGELITEGTVYLECHMTIAKIKIMIAEENNRKAFFSKYQ